jgi:TonB family protein
MELLLSVSLRVLIPAAVGAAVLTIGRVRSAAACHAVWTVVTAGMLVSLVLTPLLPRIEARVLPAATATAVTVTSSASISADAVVAEPGTVATAAISWERGAAIAYGVGAAMFLLRLAASYGFTLRLAHSSRHVEGDIYESDRIAAPVTMGWLSPRILLPRSAREWDAARMQAVLAHERAHIYRGDWAIAGLAAVNRCVFWFHPLAWWLERKLAALAEEACDDAALLETGGRAQYATILLEMAAAVKASRGRLIWEAMAMARVADVSMRIDRILDETRPISAGVGRRWRAVLLACGLPLVYAAAVLHISPAIAQEQKQTESKLPAPPAAPAKKPEKPVAQPVTRTAAPKPAAPAPSRRTAAQEVPATPAPLTLLKRVDPEYPKIAKQVGAKGTVAMMVTIAPEGHVTAVKVISGHPMLQNAAKDAVMQWVYSAHPSETALPVSLNFVGEDPPQAGRGMIQQAALISRAEPVYPAEAKAAGVTGRVVLDATIDKDGRVSKVSTVQGHPLLAQAAEDAVREWRYKPTMLNGTPVETQTRITLNFAGDRGGSVPPAMDGNSFERAEVISRKEPARQPISGTVIFRATVGIDGKLSNIRVTDAPAELVPAALDAVKQWVYRPAKLNGKPVEADTVITLRFAADR